MGRGPESAEVKRAKAAALIAQFTGKAVEEIALPDESQEDLLAEAQAVVNYFHSTRGEFKYQQCRQCGETFAYAWDRDAIKYCGITCMSKALKEIGLTWNPNKKPSERWGKTIPAVVPPLALQLVSEAQEDLHLNNQVPDTDQSNTA